MVRFLLSHNLSHMSYLDVFILSLIEGLTEFLPVSSTGHLIIASNWLGLESTDFLKAFQIIIQFGAILAVLFIYRDRFKFNFEFYKKIALASAPILVLGFILKDVIDRFLESSLIVAWSLIVGGIIFIIVDYYIKPDQSKKAFTVIDSFKIGLVQCLALVPGISRSGSTIVAAQILKYDKAAAAEFSFFIAVPVLSAATLYKFWKIKDIIESSQVLTLLTGIVLSFVFALIAIRFFIQFVSKHGFKWFGVYRIILGLIVLITAKG